MLRMKAKLGPKAATTATAHKIARIFYAIVTMRVEYDETIWATRDAQRQKRLEKKSSGRPNNSAVNWFASRKSPLRNSMTRNDRRRVPQKFESMRQL